MFCRRRKDRKRPCQRTRRAKLETLEARQLLTSYFVDAELGNDNNLGTAEAPFASYLPFVSAWGQEDRNIGKVDLGAGDVVEFAPGLYTETFRNPNDNYRGFHLRDVFGTAEAPIIIRGQPGAVLDAQPSDNHEASSLTITGGGWIQISGLEFTGFGKGIIVNGDNVVVSDNYFHDLDGTDNSNHAALYVKNASNVDISNNLFVDNFDRTNADTGGKKTENSRHAVFFANPGPIRFHHNSVFNTVSTDSLVTGSGVTVKHGEDGSFEADHNVMNQLWFHAFGTSTPRSNIHHNLIVDSGGLHVRDFGGAAYFNDMVFANNTLTAVDGNTGGGFSINMKECWYGNADLAGDDCNPNHQRPISSYDRLGPVDFSDNIVVDHRANTQDRGAVRVSTYGRDERYEVVIEQHALRTDRNVYYNTTGEPQFNAYNVNGGTRGVKGDEFDFAGWQELGFDVNGAVANPMFDDVYLPTNTVASGAGWYADQNPRLTVLIQGEESIAEGGVTQAVVVRSGDGIALSESLTVRLDATDRSEITIPQSITFEPGEAKAYFTISGLLDGEQDGTRPTRISASADGFTENVSAWVRVEDSAMGEPGFAVFETNGSTVVSESGSTDTLSVRLTARPMQNVFLTVTASDLSEASATPSTLIFNPQDWFTAQTVTVAGVDDTVVDGTQLSTVSIAVAAQSDAAWQGLSNQTFTVETTDDDERQNTPGYQAGVLVLPGEFTDTVTLSFDWIQRLGEYDNELGILVVDDIDGRVGGLLPSQAGYANAALTSDSREVLFASGAGAGEQATLEYNGGDRLVFYMIQNATTNTMLGTNPANDYSVQPMAFFSLVDANGDAFNHVNVEETEPNKWRFAWEDLVGGGDQSFTDAVVDLEIIVGDTSELAFLDIVLADQSGNSLEELHQDDMFFLDIYTEDLRASGQGVYSAFLDLEFDTARLEVVGPIQFADTYAIGRNSDLSQPGKINELGAVGQLQQLSRRELLARIPMRAISTGPMEISANPADVLPQHDVTLLGLNAAVPTSQLRYDSVQLTVQPPSSVWHNSARAVDVNDDGFLSPIDALLIINMLNGLGSQTTDTLPTPSFTAFVDTNNDGFLAPTDVLLVLNALNQPRSGGEGESQSPFGEQDKYAFSVDQAFDGFPFFERKRSGLLDSQWNSGMRVLED